MEIVSKNNKQKDMKRKYLCVLVALVAAVSVNVKAQTLLPEKGDFGLEIGFKPISGNTVFNLLDDGVKLRYFLTDNDALRLGLGFNLARVKGKTLTSLQSGYSNYDFNLGYERHWGMSDRIDLYAGAMVGYTRYLAFYDDLNVPSGRHKTTDNNGHVSGHYSMGGIFTGLDFYLWKGLYCGAEVGLKVERMKESQSSYTFASPAHTYINAGFYCEPAIRVGWTF